MAVKMRRWGHPDARWDLANSGCEDLRDQEEERFLYFAFGSNVLTERIHLRKPSAMFCRMPVICMAAKGSSLPLEYEKKLNATGPNDYKGRVSEEIKELSKREKQTHQNIEYIYGYSLYVLIYFRREIWDTSTFNTFSTIL
nr:PREDICTED: gamma-glutamylcyclotransferase-like [Rhinolophus sinicus]